MAKMRGLDVADSETTMSMREMKTSEPSIMFQPLRRYELGSRTRPVDSTFHTNQRYTAATSCQQGRGAAMTKNKTNHLSYKDQGQRVNVKFDDDHRILYAYLLNQPILCTEQTCYLFVYAIQLKSCTYVTHIQRRPLTEYFKLLHLSSIKNSHQLTCGLLITSTVLAGYDNLTLIISHCNHYISCQRQQVLCVFLQTGIRSDKKT